MQKMSGSLIDTQFSQELVYESSACQLAQIDETGRFQLSFYGESLNLKFCGLYSFYKKIKDLDLSAMFSAEHPAIEILYLGEIDRVLVFDLTQILELKEFFSGAFAMLYLNSMIQSETCRKLV